MGLNKRVFALSPFGVKVADALVAFLDVLRINPGIRRPGLINIDKPCSSEKIRKEMGWEPSFPLDQSIKDSVVD
jgi:nucleoside-diphosphate-sugar epimerase